MMKNILSTMVFSLFIVACSGPDVSKWSDEEVSAWCAESGLYNLETALPDAAVNKREYASQYMKNPKEWDAAVKFLEDEKLGTLDDGRYELTGNGTYANVQRYTTKSDADFEAHRKYIDIQYIVSGNEIIEVAPLSCVSNKSVSYSPVKDIEFYETADSSYRIKVSSDNFMILFPCDAHKPCLSDGEKSEVMKVVVKIPYID